MFGKHEWKPKRVSVDVDKVNKKKDKQIVCVCVWCGLSFIDLHFNVCSVVIQTEISIDRVQCILYTVWHFSQR